MVNHAVALWLISLRKLFGSALCSHQAAVDGYDSTMVSVSLLFPIRKWFPAGRMAIADAVLRRLGVVGMGGLGGIGGCFQPFDEATGLAFRGPLVV